MQTEKQSDQVKESLDWVRNALGDALLGVYLHGSAVSGGLQPQSDLDLLVVVSRSITEGERMELLSALLSISGRYPRRENDLRPVEVMVFVAGAAGMGNYPTQAEFIYGEWLRDAFEGGEIPAPVTDPENTLILAQARGSSIPLVGPVASELLPEISREAILSAMSDALPGLMSGLFGDERNVLLTLARMWRTSEAGDFVSKEVAAAWATPRMPNREGETLDFARRAYLGEVEDIWTDKQDAAKKAADYLGGCISL